MRRTRMFAIAALVALFATGTWAQPVTVEFWTPFAVGDTHNPVLESLIERFNQEHPHIQVVHVGTPIDQLAAKYVSAFAAGVLPDVGWGAPVQFYSRENVVPMEDLVARDDVDTSGFWPGLWKGSNMIDGIQWGWPFEVGSQGLVYNINRLESAGVGAPPATWDEFVEVGRKVTDPEQNRWALQPIWAWHEQIPQVWRNGGDVLSADQTRVTFTDPKTVEAVQWIGDLQHVHGIVGGGVPDGSAAMIIVHPGWYGFTKTFNFDVGYAQPPVPVGGQQATRSYYQELVIFRKDPERVEAAWTFVKWLMTPEHIAVWNASTGYLPTSRDVLETDLYAAWLAENPGMTAWLEMLNYVRGLPRFDGFDPIGGLFMEALFRVLNGETTAQVALSAVQDAAQSLLDEALARRRAN